MSLSKHPNLLPVHGSFVNGSKLYIVAPFLAAGSCLDIMKTAYPDGLEEASIATILKQALQGLEYLHKNGLIHRDVKAGNLLVDGDGLVQLADFGVSSSLMETGERKGHRKTFVGTPCWMAPGRWCMSTFQPGFIFFKKNPYSSSQRSWSKAVMTTRLISGVLESLRSSLQLVTHHLRSIPQ